jgi:hypothetical protein
MAQSVNLYPRDWHRIEGETVAIPQSEMTVAATWVDSDGVPHQGECTVSLAHILTHLDEAAQNEIAQELLITLARRLMGADA